LNDSASTAASKPPNRRREVIPFLSILMFLACMGVQARAQKSAQNSVGISAGQGLPFAIADLDGDHRPDFARVEGGESQSRYASYWIQLRFSSIGQQYLRVVAPAGGLLIEARDVNGDHAVDLILATAWLKQPIAIFLNDGHGRFSRIAPAAFPAAFCGPRNDWGAWPVQSVDAAGVPQESRTRFCLQAISSAGLRSHATAIHLSDLNVSPRALPSSLSARAPPSGALDA
jgi:hypothetical protein